MARPWRVISAARRATGRPWRCTRTETRCSSSPSSPPVSSSSGSSLCTAGKTPNVYAMHAVLHACEVDVAGLRALTAAPAPYVLFVATPPCAGTLELWTCSLMTAAPLWSRSIWQPRTERWGSAWGKRWSWGELRRRPAAGEAAGYSGPRQAPSGRTDDRICESECCIAVL